MTPSVSDIARHVDRADALPLQRLSGASQLVDRAREDDDGSAEPSKFLSQQEAETACPAADEHGPPTQVEAPGTSPQLAGCDCDGAKGCEYMWLHDGLECKFDASCHALSFTTSSGSPSEKTTS